MKGTNKKFNRYLDSEYNDYPVEPSTEEFNKYGIETLLKNASVQPIDLDQLKRMYWTSEMIPLTSTLIKNFAILLGEEAMGYYQHIKMIKAVDTEVFETYREFYAKFQTVPILFLSVVPGKGVYLWQVNRLCPCKKGSNHMVLDSKALKADVKAHISILLLAKIAPEEGEEIIDASFTGEGQMATRSVAGEEELVIRSYRIKDFVDLARVNPFKQWALANNKHYSKLVIRQAQTEKDSQSECLDISLWRNKTADELKKEMINASQREQAGEFKSMPIAKEIRLQRDRSLNKRIGYVLRNFSSLVGTQNGVTILSDNETTTLIAWNESKLLTSSYNKIGNIHEITAMGNDVYIKVANNKTYSLPFGAFPSVEFRICFCLSNEPKLPKLWSIKFSSGSNGSEAEYKDYTNLVYDVPISVVNPYSQEVETDEIKQIKEGEEEKKKESGSVKSISDIKNELKLKKKNEQAGLKKVLKDIRSGISAKITEIKDYKDGQQNEKERIKTNTTKEPEGVSKEAIELYSEVKTEKRRIEKEREKKKTQKKKDGCYNNSY